MKKRNNKQYFERESRKELITDPLQSAWPLFVQGKKYVDIERGVQAGKAGSIKERTPRMQGYIHAWAGVYPDIFFLGGFALNKSVFFSVSSETSVANKENFSQ